MRIKNFKISAIPAPEFSQVRYVSCVLDLGKLSFSLDVDGVHCWPYVGKHANKLGWVRFRGKPVEVGGGVVRGVSEEFLKSWILGLEKFLPK